MAGSDEPQRAAPGVAGPPPAAGAARWDSCGPPRRRPRAQERKGPLPGAGVANARYSAHAANMQFVDKETMTAELAAAQCRRCGHIGGSMHVVLGESGPHFARINCKACE